MDVFIEKIVARKKTTKDLLVIQGLVLAGLIVAFVIIPMIPLIKSMWLIFAFGVGWGVYFLIKSKNIEFEYAVTNGDLDIDRIIAQRKRKRIFSANCKEFEIVARARGEKYTPEVNRIQKRIEAMSRMDSPDLYFIVLNYKGERTLVFFEPDQRMLNAFKAHIPRKVFE